MKPCLELADLLEREAKANLLRVSIIRVLSNLAAFVQMGIVYKAYNPDDEYHIRNAAEILCQMSPQSH